MGRNLWNRDPGSLWVTPFPSTQASPPGVPDIYVPNVQTSQLGQPSGYTSGDWVTIGLVGLGLVGLGVLLASSL